MAVGEDPYTTETLSALAKREGVHQSLNPFFYPPPFLLAFSWCRPLALESAYRTWYVVNQVLLPLALVGLWRWAPGRVAALALMAVTFAGPLFSNARMGQVNVLVMALAVVGLALVERGAERTGGAVVGLACMLKMSPALLVGWWLLQRRVRPAVAACVAAIVISVAALPVAGLAVQARFYGEILPDFGAGSYHELGTPIGFRANHSLPALFHELFPGGVTTMSAAATWLSRAAAILLLAAVGWALRRPGADPVVRLAQLGVVVVLLLVLPVYAFEHHMVWLLVPYFAVMVAVAEGRLGRAWVGPLAVAYLASAAPLSWLKPLYPKLVVLGPLHDAGSLLLRESKLLAALLVAGACFVAARRVAPARAPSLPG